MSKRNLIWLVVIVAVGAVAWVAFGVVAGLIAAALTLVASEIVERRARRRRREAARNAA